MRIKYIIWISFLFILLPAFLVVQTAFSQELVKYTPDFKFKEGIYLNFEQVKKNKPTPKSRILTSADYKSSTFFDKITEEKTLVYFDDLGNSQEVEVANIWGYCKNGIIYINIGGSFSRITIVGNISHFVANITTYSNRYNSGPYGYPYGYSPYGYSPYGYYPYGGYSPSYRTTELRQFLLDFNTGKVVEYDNKNVELLLIPDPELHDEYSGLRSKKKQQLRFMYIRKYNEKHPLYIPK
ncbi:MAG: hypothetical protein LBQ60_03870 [Bacteroidales bacterium]|jgi:hypothetical protein|nr:hypothetical protein [Bacteroidales bacterium]